MTTPISLTTFGWSNWAMVQASLRKFVWSTKLAPFFSVFTATSKHFFFFPCFISPLQTSPNSPVLIFDVFVKHWLSPTKPIFNYSNLVWKKKQKQYLVRLPQVFLFVRFGFPWLHLLHSYEDLCSLRKSCSDLEFKYITYFVIIKRCSKDCKFVYLFLKQKVYLLS